MFTFVFAFAYNCFHVGKDEEFGKSVGGKCLWDEGFEMFPLGGSMKKCILWVGLR
jgi:hypothetical protein